MIKGKPVFIMIALLISWNLAAAQFSGQGRGAGRTPGQHHRDMHKKNLENLRLLKLLEILELDEDQNLEFIARFSSFRKEAREINDSINKEIEQLITYLHDDHPDENQIMQTVERVGELRIRRAEAMRRFHEDVKSILNVTQLGRMTVFEERFERELMDALGRFRNHGTPRNRPDTGP